MASLESYLLNHRKDWSLPGEFYTSRKIFQADVNHIWKKYWLFAGYTVEIPNPGDYFVFHIKNESVIIIKGDQDQYFAHFNCCRHRGSIICKEDRGNVDVLRCPYHAWTYEKDGSLKFARMMPEEFDKAGFGLHSAQIEILEGLIFISFSDHPPPFSQVAKDLGPYLNPFQLERGKIAHKARYKIRGNWKLIAENFRECYHCGPAHPEYSKAVVVANLLDDSKVSEYQKRCTAEWIGKGLPVKTVDFVDSSFHYCIRYPLREGFSSYSLDGKPVSILMGKHQDYNNGVVGLVTYPNFWMDGVSDYTWSMRLNPVEVNQTIIDVTFMVAGGAELDSDYKLEKLVEFWEITGGQDWELISNNQLGIESGKYKPGPFAPVEKDVSKFDEWYINRLREKLI